MSVFVKQNSFYSEFCHGAPWIILNPIEQSIKEKIEAIGTPLREWNITINYGIKTGYNDAFIIDGSIRKQLIAEDEKSAEIIRPILRGRDIKRYECNFADLWVIYIPWHFPLESDNTIIGASKKAEDMFAKHFPAVYNYLLFYKEKLEKRNAAETGIRYEWYALQRWGAKYRDDFSKQKIVWGEISDKTKFALDSDGIFYCEATTFLMTGAHLKYLLCFLNSKFSEYYFSKIGTTTGVGTVRWKKFKIETLPVPPVSQEQELKFEKLLMDLLSALKNNSSASIEEEAINNEIYSLLKLSEKEIEFINNFRCI